MHLISISYPAIFRSLYKANINSKCNITSILRAVQTERVIRSRIGRFNTRLKCAQIKNSLSYCVNACNLRRSERAIKPTTRKHIDKQTWTWKSDVQVYPDISHSALNELLMTAEWPNWAILESFWRILTRVAQNVLKLLRLLFKKITFK